jgi:SH3-like domain-containing protein
MRPMRVAALAAILGMFLGVVPSGVGAEDGTTAGNRGPVTNLPLPRFVSLKASEGNARRGPGMTHRVDWVFKRRDMPLMVTAEFEHWRRVQDADGAGGWMHFALLSGARTVLVERDMTALHLQPDSRAPVVSYVEAGVVARIMQCAPEWCRINAGGQRGWAPRDALWGVAEGEIIE